MDWDWIAIGTWLAVVYVCTFAFVGAVLALRRYRRAAPLSVAAALFFAFAGTVAAQKGGGTNEPPRLAVHPVRAAAQPPRPSAPAKVAKINARGAWRDSFLLEFSDGFLFPFGTNRLSSVEIFTQGYVRPSRRSSEIVADTGLRAAIVPGVSSISVELTPSNSWRVEWTDAAQNRDTNALVSASIELMRSGDMSVTTNGVTRTIPRVHPHDLDGDGIPDALDANPGVCDGDFFGPQDALPPDANTNAYCWVDLVVHDADAEVVFSGDGYSDLADPHFMARAEATNRVTILIGKGYEVTCDEAIECVGVSDEAIEVWNHDERSLHVRWPVMIEYIDGDEPQRGGSLLRSRGAALRGNGAPGGLSRRMRVVPDWLGGEFEWATNHCCGVSMSGFSLLWSCGGDCGCGGCEAHGDYVYEGYRIYAFGGLCGCVPPPGDPVEPGPSVSLSLRLPATIFTNTDDDNDDGEEDFVRPLSELMDDDVAKGALVFSSSVPTGGTVSVTQITGLGAELFDDTGLYRNAVGSMMIAEGAVCGTVDSSSWSNTIYASAVNASPSYRAGRVQAAWTAPDGDELTDTAVFTVVEPVAEPICNETVEVVHDGVLHRYTVNPCGVAVGRDAYFRIAVAPEDFPDGEILWSAEGTGAVAFVGGSTGRSVRVRGVAPGEARLVVRIGDCESSPPSFKVRVVEPTVVNLRAWIIEDDRGTLARTPDEVRAMVAEADDIYAQVGVTLNLVEPIVVTNIPDAYNALYHGSSSASVWSFDSIVDIASGTGGLECYFVGGFPDAPHVMGSTCGRGMVLTRRATSTTLAHEIGHSFGLQDIYTSSKESDALADDVSLSEYLLVGKEFSPDDWNGGCDGHGRGGVRYYSRGTTMQSVIGRMLMYGSRQPYDTRRDITAGGVYGVVYDWVEDTKVFRVGTSWTGFFELNVNPHPTHQ